MRVQEEEQEERERRSDSGESDREERDDRPHYENERSSEVCYDDLFLKRYMLNPSSSESITLQADIVKNIPAEDMRDNEPKAAEGALEEAYLADSEVDSLVVVRAQEPISSS